MSNRDASPPSSNLLSPTDTPCTPEALSQAERRRLRSQEQSLSSSQATVRTPQKKTSRQDNSKAPDTNQTTTTAHHVPTLTTTNISTAHIYFDGGSRSVGSASAAIFIDQPHVYLCEQHPTHLTNNAAETRGLLLALSLVKHICETTPCRDFVISGDSTYVIMLATIGHHMLMQRSTFSNTSCFPQWNMVGALMLTIQATYNVHVSFRHHLRLYNCAPDELCSALLEARTIDTTRLVTVPVPTVTQERLLQVAVIHRPSRRSIPLVLQPHWLRVVSLIEQQRRNNPTDPIPWMILLLAPKLILHGIHPTQLRRHLSTLQTYDDVIRLAAAADISPPTVRRPAPTTQDWLDRGEIAKALDSIIEPPFAIASQLSAYQIDTLWPATSDTSVMIDHAPQFVTDAPTVRHIIRRCLKKKKSPDIGGWTSELIDAGWATPDLALFLCDLVNAPLSPSVLTLLRFEKGLATQTGRKVRPICITWVFTKIVWHSCRIEHNIKSTPYEYNAYDGAIVVGQHLAMTRQVQKLDCSNAFNSISRATIRAELLAINATSYYQPWNRFYGDNWTVIMPGLANVLVRTGVKQGCVAAKDLFALGLRTAVKHMLSSIPNKIVIAVVDDLHIVDPPPNIIDLARASLKLCGLSLNADKSSHVSHTEPSKVLGTWISSPPITTSFILDKLRSQLDLILATSAARHFKWFLINQFFRRTSYLLKALQAHSMMSVTSAVSSLWLSTLSNIAGQQLPSTLIQCRSELGGCNVGFDPMIPHWMSLQRLTIAKHIPSMSTTSQEDTISNSSERALRDAWLTKHFKTLETSLPHGLLHIQQKHIRTDDFISYVPSRMWKLTDEQFTAAVALKCGLSPTWFKPACPNVTTAAERYDHATKCKTCAKVVVRHNHILYQISRCLLKHGIISQVNPNDRPLPSTLRANPSNVLTAVTDTSQKGPDAHIYIGDVPSIDVSVVSPWATNTRDWIDASYQKKIATYSEWKTMYKRECYPIIISIFGNIHSNTITTFELWEKESSNQRLTKDISTSIRKALPQIMSSILISTSTRTTVRATVSSGT